jgi:dTDP-4-amino-4,6-dideoxygalactose transaminase
MDKLALFDGNPVVQGTFPEWPIFDQREVQAVQAIVESGQWWMTNPVIAEFERDFAQFQGTEKGLAVTNGTHTLEIILRALGIGLGDEVIVPAYTFIATATAVLMTGATPILVDVDADTFTLDPEKFREAITPRTKAVIPVHFAGVTGRIDEILQIAQDKKLFVVEDCAHAHGAESRGRRTGSLGIAGSFSFQAYKTMTAGEGGAIVTNHPKLYEKCWSLYNCGRPYGGTDNKEYSHLGSNYRMTPFQAALLQIQLQRMTEQIPQRLANIAILDAGLGAVEGIMPQYRDPQDKAPGYLYCFYYDAKAFNGLSRSMFIKALRAEGVPCSAASYPAIHHTTLFRNRCFGANGQKLNQDSVGNPLPDYAKLTLPNSERIEKEAVFLPHQIMLGETQQMQAVVEAIQKIQLYAQKSASPLLSWGIGMIRKKVTR